MNNIMNQYPLISIIIPVYNAEHLLKQCLDSVLSQTYPNWEAILIDDGSTDHSFNICKSYADNDERFIVKHKENGGPSSARNLGLEICHGQYIGFCDSDDRMHPNMLEELYLAILKNNCQISIMKWKEEVQCDFEHYTVFSAKNAFSRLLYDKEIGGYSWSKLFKSDLLSNVRFDKSVCLREDNLFSAEAILKSENVCYINDCFYDYLDNDSSIVHSVSDKYLSTMDAMEKIISLTKDKYPDLLPLSHFAFIHASIDLLKRFWYGRHLTEYNFNIVKDRLKPYVCKKDSWKYLTFNDKVLSVASLLDRNIFSLAMQVNCIVHPNRRNLIKKE